MSARWGNRDGGGSRYRVEGLCALVSVLVSLVVRLEIVGGRGVRTRDGGCHEADVLGVTVGPLHDVRADRHELPCRLLARLGFRSSPMTAPSARISPASRCGSYPRIRCAWTASLLETGPLEQEEQAPPESGLPYSTGCLPARLRAESRR